MTFCLSMRVKEGVIGVADTRITSGTEYITARKITIRQISENNSYFLMTSGLRSVRDKAITYYDEIIDEIEPNSNKLYKIVNAFASQVRRVAEEDKVALQESGYMFNLSTLIAGQLNEDKEPKVYLLYPQGNWVEISYSTPYFIIGNSGHGKPLLDRVLKYESTMEFALKAGILAFDATRISSNDVGYPIDVALFLKDSHKIIYHRFERDDLNQLTNLWHDKISEAIDNLPEDWINVVLDKLKPIHSQ
ncbi:MAG: hypothetical protein KDK90_12625 [Leptospiraceae bacterium]|nr:hypothetical protein [Leptospiraceae bacterium]